VCQKCARAEIGPPGSGPVGSEPAKVVPRDGEARPTSVTADNTHANTGAKESSPAELEPDRVLPANAEDFAAAATVDGADGKIPVADSTKVAWKPKAPSGPIWSRR
jgi:hypothetical protein